MLQRKHVISGGFCLALGIGAWFGIARAHDLQSTETTEIVETFGKAPSAEQIAELEDLIEKTSEDCNSLSPHLMDRQIVEQIQMRFKDGEFYEIIDYKGFMFLTFKMPEEVKEFARHQKPGALFNLLNCIVVNRQAGKYWLHLLARS